MNILLLGSGGREHTLAWKIAQSKITQKLFIAPGNAGTGLIGTNVSLKLNDFDSIKSFVLSNSIDLVVTGPEEPLVNGIYDYFKADRLLHKVAVLGPSKQGAMLEGSKDFAKDFMIRHHIPTAAYKTFKSSEIREAAEFIRSMNAPYVLKADGLAAGKGVVIVNSEEEALNQLDDMLINKRFGAASEKVVIEQFLKGIELSVFILTDGINWVLLPEAKDYKRIGVNDTGPNTGGMGSISPVPFADEVFMTKVKDQIIKPTIKGLQADNIDYKGFVFFGLINVEGNPFVIEYNVRMGDPETESVIPRISSDLVPLLLATAKGDLSGMQINIDPRAAATVMLVSGGYPGSYQKGFPISGLYETGDSLIFHAGTAINIETGEVVTSGGRVIAITSLADTAKDALNLSFSKVDDIDFQGKYYRKDLGFDIIK
ncbi:MAG: phosphoribosylamine--glycine ligase [Lentimicrobiaceae bacterium]